MKGSSVINIKQREIYENALRCEGLLRCYRQLFFAVYMSTSRQEHVVKLLACMHSSVLHPVACRLRILMIREHVGVSAPVIYSSMFIHTRRPNIRRPVVLVLMKIELRLVQNWVVENVIAIGIPNAIPTACVLLPIERKWSRLRF